MRISGTEPSSVILSQTKLLKKWKVMPQKCQIKLKSLRKFYGRYRDLTKQYEVPLSRILHFILDDEHIQWHPPLIGHYTIFDHY